MINLENVTKNYGKKRIFSSANFEAESGEITLLTGKSGVGKSTLLDIISGIKQYNSGVYFYNGQQLRPEDDEKMCQFRNEKIGYILQDFALIDDYTILENLTLPVLYSSKHDEREVVTKAREYAFDFELTAVLEEKARVTSGGQKQRAAIIRSLVLEPEIILADEPTTNLDAENFSLIIKIFKELKQKNKIVIIATHDERIRKIADKVYHIENYKLRKS